MLHTWGSALTHHPHVHCIVPGGGLSADGRRWIACRRGFFLPARVLSRLFRRLFPEKLAAAHARGRLSFFGDLPGLAHPEAFTAQLAPLRRAEWVVYAKPRSAGRADLPRPLHPPTTSKPAGSSRATTDKAAPASACPRRHGTAANHPDLRVSRNPHRLATHHRRPAG